MQDGGTTPREALVGLVSLRNEQALHAEGLGDFMVVQRVSDEQDPVARDGEPFKERAPQIEFRMAV